MKISTIIKSVSAAALFCASQNYAAVQTATDGNLVGNGTLAERFAEAYKLAEETVDSGKAEALFDKWIETAKSKA